jgi:hypothetical protein
VQLDSLGDQHRIKPSRLSQLAKWECAKNSAAFVLKVHLNVRYCELRTVGRKKATPFKTWLIKGLNYVTRLDHGCLTRMNILPSVVSTE